jgi:nucleotide-binding universal stress UspA family protein
MFDRVVIGYDGSDGAEDALALGTTIAPIGSAIRVVHAIHGPVMERSEAAERAGREEAEAPLDGARRRLRGRPGARFVVEIGPSVGRTLQRAAERWPADLIVLGSTRRAIPGRVDVGHVADRTLHEARCPVLLTPAGYRARVAPIERIGVGFPGTGESRAALLLAVRLGERVGAELDVIDAAIPPEDVEAVEAAVAGVVGSSSAYVEAEAPEGDPVDILVERSHRLDLLVLGQRGLGALHRRVSRSVSHDVLRRAACPVLVTPRP